MASEDDGIFLPVEVSGPSIDHDADGAVIGLVQGLMA